MRKIVFTFILIFALNIAKSQDLQAFAIFDNHGNKVTFSDIVKKASKSDMVFYGELHNNPIAHWIEYRLAKELYTLKKDKLIIGAEMFEADNQLIIDEYMQDLITDKYFEDECRLWPNYATDYKPIVEFAKENKIPFIATNVPRRYANIVYKQDFAGLDKVSEEAKRYIAPLPIKFDPNVDCYKDMMAGMQGMAHGGQTIAKAQALKDATMAYFIMKNWQKGKLFYHFNGSYHSDRHQGIVWYLKQSKPKLKILTITTVSQKDVSKLEDDNKILADFIVVVADDMTTTY